MHRELASDNHYLIVRAKKNHNFGVSNTKLDWHRVSLKTKRALLSMATIRCNALCLIAALLSLVAIEISWPCHDVFKVHKSTMWGIIYIDQNRDTSTHIYKSK